MSKRALCLLCGTDLKDGKPVIVDDLRTLVERWEDEDRNDTYRTPLSRPAQLRKLLRGE